MPYAWTCESAAEVGAMGKPLATLRLWPHRSLPRRGFAAFIAVTAALASVPLLIVLGSPVLWGLLPFVLGMLGGVWLALQYSYRSGEIVEELRLWPGCVLLTRCEPRRPVRTWKADPYWVRMAIHATGGPVPNYLTLSGAGRTVEIGAFLSGDERVELQKELEDAMRGTLAEEARAFPRRSVGMV